ncbi:hypothetical protein [Streptomyces sp. NPDC093707]|uniref:hypothetical protein n=1 Tax=Streptomyces sp. NPDC093707 TaxID=3154984 RepID=UPI00344EA536
MSTLEPTNFHIDDARAVLAAAGVPVLAAGSQETGVLITSDPSLADSVLVVPVVKGLEGLPAAMPANDERRAEWVRLIASSRKALTAAGWERECETPRYGRFSAYTPAVRLARMALMAADIRPIPPGSQFGEGVKVAPADGDHRMVRVTVAVGRYRHQPFPGDRSAEGQAWYERMRAVFWALTEAGWSPFHGGATFRVPDGVSIPERPVSVLGCDPGADAFVQRVAGILRQHGHLPCAAGQGPAGTVWGFTVIAPMLAADHVRVTYDHNGPGPVDVSAPRAPQARRKFFATLEAYERDLRSAGLTVADQGRDRTSVWVPRPDRDVRARILLAERTGFLWFPELAEIYRHETRWTEEQPWRPQLVYSGESVKRTVEVVLRKGWSTATAAGQAIYLESPRDSDFAPFSRYVPVES